MQGLLLKYCPDVVVIYYELLGLAVKNYERRGGGTGRRVGLKNP